MTEIRGACTLGWYVRIQWRWARMSKSVLYPLYRQRYEKFWMFIPIIARPRYSTTLTASIIASLWTNFPIIQDLVLLSTSIHRHKLQWKTVALSRDLTVLQETASLGTAVQKRSATESLHQEIKLEISLSRLTLNNLFQSFRYFKNKTSDCASLAQYYKISTAKHNSCIFY
jgi:hypothetical protein